MANDGDLHAALDALKAETWKQWEPILRSIVEWLNRLLRRFDRR